MPHGAFLRLGFLFPIKFMLTLNYGILSIDRYVFSASLNRDKLACNVCVYMFHSFIGIFCSLEVAS